MTRSAQLPLLYEKHDQVAYITFNRPEKHNAITPEMVVRLANAWRDFSDEDDLRAAIITGVGERAFCAGADLGSLIPLITHAREPQDEWDEKLRSSHEWINTAFLRGYSTYKPVIAAINGFCLAGGTEMAMATDLRVAAEHATLGLTEAQRGLIPFGGSLARLPRQIGYSDAMEILLLAEPIDAQRALKMRLVNWVVPAAKLMAKARALAERLAENGPLALRKIKETVLRSSGMSLEEAFRVEDECGAVIIRSEDAREGPRAFMEKRKPNFTGR
jgi:enoyl-CoA hydratase